MKEIFDVVLKERKCESTKRETKLFECIFKQQNIGKYCLAGSEFNVVLRRSYKTERQVVVEKFIFFGLNDLLLPFICFKNTAASRKH